LDIFELVDDLDQGDELFVRAGLAVGPITVGLTGGSQLIHETWGVTVQRATDLARNARSGQVLVSNDCGRLLPERYRLEPSAVAGASVLSTADTPQEATT
jgi:class 3 adenylate cyclase